MTQLPVIDRREVAQQILVSEGADNFLRVKLKHHQFHYTLWIRCFTYQSRDAIKLAWGEP